VCTRPTKWRGVMDQNWFYYQYFDFYGHLEILEDVYMKNKEIGTSR
jgi:hypothetical protein